MLLPDLHKEVLDANFELFTLGINQQAAAIGRFLHDQHCLRKDGQAAYYGQPKGKK